MSPADFNTVVNILLGAMRNYDAYSPMVREHIGSWNADGEYLVDGMYESNDVRLGMLDLHGNTVSSVYRTTNHVVNVYQDLAIEIAKGLAN